MMIASRSSFPDLLAHLFNIGSGIQWTSGIHSYQMFDYGICYMFYFDGHFYCAIDGGENAYDIAMLNHFGGVFTVVPDPELEV